MRFDHAVSSRPLSLARPRTHALFPAASRAFAVEALLLGHALSRQPRFAGEEGSIVDIWTTLVMPSAVVR